MPGAAIIVAVADAVAHPQAFEKVAPHFVVKKSRPRVASAHGPRNAFNEIPVPSVARGRRLAQDVKDALQGILDRRVACPHRVHEGSRALVAIQIGRVEAVGLEDPVSHAEVLQRKVDVPVDVGPPGVSHGTWTM